MTAEKLRTGRPAFWLITGAGLLLAGLTLALTALNGLTLERYVAEFILAGLTGGLAFTVVGALIAGGRLENAIGRLLAASGLAFLFTSVLHQYVRYALVTRPGVLPFGEPAAWLNAWLWVPIVCSFLFFLPLYFPDGRLPSTAWRWAPWVSGLATLLFTVILAITPGPIDASLLEVSNPYAPAWAEDALRWLHPLALLTGGIGLAAAVGAPAARLRWASGIERQQIKWFAYAVALLAGAYLLPVALYFPDFTQSSLLSGLLLAAALPLVPLAVGFAVLRYRLYEIDVIIRRTLLYSALSAVLALIYLGAVLLFQSVIIALSGTTGDLAVVASTLLIAALFHPLRRGLQRLIDLRFYRGKVDPARVLASFSAAARSEVDLERISVMLLDSVEESLQPEFLSLWMVKK